MLEIATITDQVLQNCNVSDSRHAGVYSVCGLALRLRDMYKWEKGLDPWVEKESSEVLEWIGDREQKWENLAEADFEKITVLGTPYDPFDTLNINAVLAPQGFFYGAGYARSLKPTFFLAVLEEKKMLDGHTIYLLGRELARDLFTAPALVQDDCILIRKDSAKLLLWDKIFYIKASGKHALRFALENYGLKDHHPEVLRENLGRISVAETETYIYHELGEIRDTVFDRKIWREIIAAHPHSLVELLSRTVKDLLADTNEFGTFRYITRERKTASLAFYVAFIEGLTKELFPELRVAFEEFIQTHDWNLIERAVSAGYNRARQYAETIISIYREGRQKNDNKWVENEITKRLLAHLDV